MENVFLELFNMSITASWLVLAIVLFRLIFKKAPKWLRVIMWGLVGLRLICPFSFESVLSLIPSAEPVPPEIVHSHSSADVSGAEIFNAIGNNQVYYDLGVQDGSIVFTEYSAPDGDFINPLLIITYIASIVWIVGMVAMLLYTLISYLRILKNVREATPLKENIWVCDNISTPFILGIIKPRIFLPSSMNEQDTEFVIAHEKAHLKRRDHLWKPFGFALLTVYWFNPVLWVAYILLCRDIELACDEKVIKEMGAEIKKPYSEALINCSVPRKMISACPLAFGETGVKGRIKSVLNYKKPAFWVIIMAVATCIVLAVCFLTNPATDNKIENMGGVTNITIGSEYEGVSINFETASFSGESRYIELLWENKTDKQVFFGEPCYIYKKHGNEWVECKLPENYAWTMIAYLLNADSTTTHKYGLYGYEDFTAGKYRFETYFSFEENRQENYKVWIDFELVSVTAESDTYKPIELVYDNGMFSFVQTIDIAPTYFVTKNMKLTEVFPDGSLYERGKLEEISLNKENWDSRFSSEMWSEGYSYSQIKENNKKAWQLKVDNGKEDISILYLLLEQKDGTYFIAYGMYNNQSEQPTNKDDSLIRWLYLVEKNDIKINLQDTTSQEENTTEETTEENTTEESTTKETTTKAYVPTPLVPLSAQKALKIKQDYLEFHKDLVEETEKELNCNVIVEDVYLSKYYGTYGDCVAMMIDSRYFGKSLGDAETKIQVGDYLFAYPTLKQIDVYRNGKFADLDEAYKKGWLSDEDVRDIHYYHSNKKYIEYDFYNPTPITPLSTEKAIKIKQDYLEWRRKNVENTKSEGEYDDLTVDDVNLEHYFGTYNGCYVVLIEFYGDIHMDALTTEYIAGYRFDYNYIRTTKVYHNGEFINLRDAHSNGLLSEKDIKDIHYYHTTRYFVIED